MAVDEAVPPETGGRSRRLTSVVALLTAAKVLASASGFITGPLLARALGASGRGDLAAVQVPFLLAPVIIGLGIPAYAYRELPRGKDPREVLGSLGLPLVLIGILAAVAAVPVASLFAAGRPTVEFWLTVGFLLMPLILVGSLLIDALVALQRWWSVAATIVLPFVPPLVGTVVLYLLGDLTVGWASALTIAGALLAIVPALPLLKEFRRPVFRMPVARKGVAFGVKSWAGGLALLANLRLDQLLMITWVAPRVLGLYSVAVTYAGATTLATGPLSQSVIPRIAAGERLLIARAVRMALLVTVVLNALLAIVAPLVIVGLFGSAFSGAVPMAWLLLIGAVPYGAASVLASGLQADGAPLIPSIAEGVALIVTVTGLILFLKPFGGEGAAVVSDIAYTTSMCVQIALARRRLGVRVHDFIVPTSADLRWAVGLVPVLSRRFRLA
jgi:O-antigen/teichoic acid export membrane protein